MLTILLSCLFLLFSAIKFEHLWNRFNPQISSYLLEVEDDVTINLNDRDFRLAFSIEDYVWPHRLKDDPAYTKWFARIWGKKEGVPYEKQLDLHLCTDVDYSEFYPIRDASAALYDAIRADP